MRVEVNHRTRCERARLLILADHARRLLRRQCDEMAPRGELSCREGTNAFVFNFTTAVATAATSFGPFRAVQPSNQEDIHGSGIRNSGRQKGRPANHAGHASTTMPESVHGITTTTLTSQPSPLAGLGRGIHHLALSLSSMGSRKVGNSS
jgi:hypothetical protein